MTQTEPAAPDAPGGTRDTTEREVDRDAAARRLRLRTILAVGLLALLTLLTTTQTWWTLHLAGQSIAVEGTVAAPALSALSLTDLALAAALAIAGPLFRLILGLLQLLVSVTVVLSSILSLAKPDQSSESLVSKATGVAGQTAIEKLITGVSDTPWGWIAIVLGVLSFLVGLWLLATFRLWPTASRKYQAVQLAPADGSRDSVVDWDSLTGGDDPTDDVAGAPDDDQRTDEPPVK